MNPLYLPSMAYMSWLRLHILQWCMVRELFELARESQQDNKLPGFRSQQWYFFGAATFFFYLRYVVQFHVYASGLAKEVFVGDFNPFNCGPDLSRTIYWWK